MKPAALLLLVATLCGSSAAEPLGRLFFTPEQRAAADRQRAAQAAGTTRTLDGILIRSTGQATLWINGQPQHGSAATLGIPRQTHDRAALAADGKPAVLLRVGESMDTSTGEKTDVIAPGSIRKSR